MTSEEFAERVLGMKDTLFRVCYAQLRHRCDYEDAVQECLQKAWKNRDRLKNERYMQTWVIHILVNECHNIQRQRKREVLVDVLPEQDPEPQPGTELALHEALLRLDQKLRLPIVLYYLENYRLAEIAKILRLPQSTVASRMNRAKLELKKYYSDEVFSRG
jgi:RNA polymerase sigma-70 factor, ECF subfamily